MGSHQGVACGPRQLSDKDVTDEQLNAIVAKHQQILDVARAKREELRARQSHEKPRKTWAQAAFFESISLSLSSWTVCPLWPIDHPTEGAFKIPGLPCYLRRKLFWTED